MSNYIIEKKSNLIRCFIALLIVSCLNQSKNTADVTKWFEGINNKHQHTFISFDVIDFYPSISQNLLENALPFASKFDIIKKDEIIHMPKSRYFSTLEMHGKNITTTFLT